MWDRLKAQLKQMGIQKQVEEELRTGIALQERVAQREQARLAAANQRNPRRGVDGLGQTTLSMHPFFRALADIQFGPGWQKDKTQVRKLLMDHPEFGVPYARKAQVSVIKPG